MHIIAKMQRNIIPLRSPCVSSADTPEYGHVFTVFTVTHSILGVVTYFFVYMKLNKHSHTLIHSHTTEYYWFIA